MNEIFQRAMAYASRRMEEYHNLSEEAEYVLWLRFRDAHEAGAKEQKTIDDAELHQRFEKVLNGQKWDLIDKACDAHCRICDYYHCCPYEFEGCYERNEIRKAMEE